MTPDKLGPRVVVKDDRDSSIGRGCQLFAAHFTPVVMELLSTMVRAFALTLQPYGIKEIHLTEGWRHIRESRDLHNECKAIDFTAIVAGGRATAENYNIVAAQARKWLGGAYDVIVHDAGSGMHIHVEYDPKSKGN